MRPPCHAQITIFDRLNTVDLLSKHIHRTRAVISAKKTVQTDASPRPIFTYFAAKEADFNFSLPTGGV